MNPGWLIAGLMIGDRLVESREFARLVRWAYFSAQPHVRRARRGPLAGVEAAIRARVLTDWTRR